MKVAGIICEFNPFHKGHQYLIDETRKAGAEGIVCVMSGDFVQRGQPAAFDKFDRAQDAVNGGADIVLELPAVYAVNSADYFARGGIRVLKRLGCVDLIAFGSECGDISALKNAANASLCESRDFSERIKKLQSEGLSYPKAYAKAAAEEWPELDATVFSEPNNTLALCYLREIIRENAPFEAFTVKRTFPYSASEIREGLDPKLKSELEENLYAIVRHKVLSTSPADIARVCEVSEGLENRLVSAIQRAESLEDLVQETKSARYTYSKISRILMQLVLGIDKGIVEEAEANKTAYAKVLAFNEKGASLLKTARDNGDITVISNVNKNVPEDASELKLLGIDIMSSDIYSILCGRAIDEFSDRVRIPIITKY